jgi:hypothetical protein
MRDAGNSVRPEPVEGPSFRFGPVGQEGQGFGKLGPNGFPSGQDDD